MGNRITKFLLLLNVALLMACQSTCKEEGKEPTLSDEMASTETTRLYQKLQKELDRGIMLGHKDDLAYGYDWFQEEGRSDVKSVCGDYPAVYGWDIGLIEKGSAVNCDSISFASLRSYVSEVNRQGGISLFTWQAGNPMTGGDASDCSKVDVVKQIVENDSVQKIFLASLDKVADFFAGLKDEAGKPIAVIFQPFHAHCADRPLWWNTSLCSADDYKRLWTLTVDYLRDKKQIHNLLYAYSVYNRSTDYLAACYPGNRYVDLVGLNALLLQEEEYDELMFIQDLNRSLAIVTQFAQKNKKIPAITGTGMEGIKVSTFFSQSLYPIISQYKLSFVLFGENAWNEEKHYFIPVPGHPASEDFAHFVAYPNILTCRDIKNKD